MKKKVFYVTMAAIFATTSCTNELPNPAYHRKHVLHN